MSPSAKRGLQLAKDLLRRWRLEHRKASFGTDPQCDDVAAAIQWIAHQEKIDDKRRTPRSAK